MKFSSFLHTAFIAAILPVTEAGGKGNRAGGKVDPIPHVLRCRSDAVYGQVLASYPQLASFRSLAELCESWDGLRFNCNNEGTLSMGMPPSPLFGGAPPPQILQQMCISNCVCTKEPPSLFDLWPKLKEPLPTVFTLHDCLVEYPDTVSGSKSSKCKRKFTCDRFKGRPLTSDCAVVVDKLTTLGDESVTFVNRGDVNAERNDKTVVLPHIITAGSCSVALSFNTTSTTNSTKTTWKDVATSLTLLAGSCAKSQDMGGHTEYSVDGGKSAIDMAMFSPTSHYKRFFDRMHQCTSEEQCSVDTIPIALPPATIKPAAQPQCGQTCQSHGDCDIANDCICAMKDQPDWGNLSPSWGRFTCSHVINAFAAMAVVSTYSQCRGRCLQAADGSLIVNETYSVSLPGRDGVEVIDVPVTPSRTSVPVADLAGLESAVASTVPTEDAFASLHAYEGKTELDRAVDPPESSASVVQVDFDLAPAPPLASASTSALRGATAVPGVRGWLCPCNCTYISSACCLNDVVHEDPRNNALAMGHAQLADPGCREQTSSAVAKPSPSPVRSSPGAQPQLADTSDDKGIQILGKTWFPDIDKPAPSPTFTETS